MIGQGLEFVCPQCGVIRNCIMRERDSEKHIGFKEYYLDCYICHHKFTNSVIDQENERYFKEQKIAKEKGIYLVVKGEPVPQGRPRFASVQGKFIHAYDPKKSVNYKNLVKWHIRQFQMTYPEVPILKENIFMDLKVFRPIPTSFSKKKLELIKEGKLFPNTKPDTDNYVKTVLDAANGMVFKDDSAVIGILARKFYSDEPRIEVIFYEITDKDKFINLT